MRSFVVALLLAVSANASTFVVSNTGDNGAGSLRQAILDANANPGADLITFAIGNGPVSIAVVGSLPAIAEAVTIDGTTQPGFAGQPIVEVYGTTVDGTTVGFDVAAGGSTIRGLIVNRFATEMHIAGGGNVVAGNWLGIDTTGNAAAVAYGTLQKFGIELRDSRMWTIGDRIGGTSGADRNVISGHDCGIDVRGTCCMRDSAITGNYIGTNASGTAAIPQRVGINATGSTQIGTANPGGGNVVSGNETGIALYGWETVQGNFVGLDASGTFAVPNTNGVVVSQGSPTIGGTAPYERNVISGNRETGIAAFGGIVGNFVGTDVTGRHAVPNRNGIVDASHAGGVGPGNLVSGNTGTGVAGAGTVFNNRIGVAADDLPLGNGVGVSGSVHCVWWTWNGCAGYAATSTDSNVIAFNRVSTAGEMVLTNNLIYGDGIGNSTSLTAFAGRTSTKLCLVQNWLPDCVPCGIWSCGPRWGCDIPYEVWHYPAGLVKPPVLVSDFTSSHHPSYPDYFPPPYVWCWTVPGYTGGVAAWKGQWFPPGSWGHLSSISFGYRATERVDSATTVSVSTTQPSITYGDTAEIDVRIAAVDPRLGSPDATTVSILSDGATIFRGNWQTRWTTLEVPMIAAGTHNIVASFTGDGFLDPAVSSPISLTVNPAPTKVTITSPHEVPLGTPLKASVGVSVVAYPSLKTAGEIVASVNHRAIAQKTFNGDPITFDLPLSAGSQLVTFSFHGSPNFAPSSSDVTVTVSEVAFVAPTVTIPEGNDDHVVQVPVRLLSPSTHLLSVDYQTSDGTATAGSDYEAAHGTLVFQPGVTTQLVPIRIFGDTQFEDDETINLTLSNALGAPIRNPNGTIVLANDDFPYAQPVRYEYAKSLFLELYAPAPGTGPSPLILWIPGNVAFDSLPENIPALEETKFGYAVAVVPYRPAPTATFPAQLEDLRTALAWIRANASMLNVDATRIAAWGDGAGGTLAALLGESHDVQAVIDRGGFSDLPHLASDAPPCGALDESPLVDLLGCSPALCSDTADAASPVRQATAAAAPFLIMHGENDCLVPAVQSLRLATALQTAGADVTIKTYPLVAHFDAFWSSAECLAEIENFLTRTLRPPR